MSKRSKGNKQKNNRAGNQSRKSSSTLSDEPNPGRLLKKYALQRASAVMAAVGAAQVLALVGLLLFGDQSNPTTRNLIPWLYAVALAGLFYLVWVIPVRQQKEWARYAAIITALVQALVFATLAILSVIKAAEVNIPQSMTMGVILFGTIASVHLFILRWLTPYGWTSTEPDPPSTYHRPPPGKQPDLPAESNKGPNTSGDT